MERKLVAIAIILAAGLIGIIPPFLARATGMDANTRRSFSSKPLIMATAEKAGSFSTLIAAVRAAGLDTTLNRPGPYTVFAPTDKAFSSLPPGMLDELMKPENRDKLRKILKYHVLTGKASAKDISDLRNVQTIEGDLIRVSVDKGELNVKINDANIIRPDIKAGNGVLHAIDKVLIPST